MSKSKKSPAKPDKMTAAEARRILKRAARLLTKERLIRTANIADCELRMWEMDRSFDRIKRSQVSQINQLSWLEQEEV